MTSAAPTVADVTAKVHDIGPPGTPVTTPEVAEGFDCTTRTIYNRLSSLVEDGVLRTKKVGANSRVWWRPAATDRRQVGSRGRESGFALTRSSTPRWSVSSSGERR
ncbi:helix-turn-helix transcriptional regulator [Haloferax sp. ATB1]|uniref:helix-turn-helix transcriptional regulator n=1 Tax=Haloferax sp. ATB1 TaxID=1508454 RepID=UPI0005B1FAD1|nr:helix-turn-helix transcriptional regulator [Haloferax sp. ATB1]